MLVYVRPSNEALLRARVPGAQDQRVHLAAPYPRHYFIFKGSLVDPRLRTLNEINAPSKLARYLSGMGAE